jgi:uncharacterized membrane protein
MGLQDRQNGLAGRSDAQSCNHEQLANGLGWFSIGLGLSEIVAPGKVAHFIGLNDTDRRRSVLRLYGLRELAAGIGILGQRRPAGWLWARVAGDALDLTSLGCSFTASDADGTRLGMATASVLCVTALDVLCAQRLSESSDGTSADNRKVSFTKTIIVNRPPDEVYRFWRDFNNLPRFMTHVESVQVAGNRSHWKVKMPGGKTVEWDAEMVEDEPGSRISWRSVDSSPVHHSGSVYFERATGGRGTVVKVKMQYAPPGGTITAKVAKLFGASPGQQVEDDLRAFKQVMETGEVVKSDASIYSGMHPAQPPADR